MNHEGEVINMLRLIALFLAMMMTSGKILVMDMEDLRKLSGLEGESGQERRHKDVRLSDEEAENIIELLKGRLGKGGECPGEGEQTGEDIASQVSEESGEEEVEVEVEVDEGENDSEIEDEGDIQTEEAEEENIEVEEEPEVENEEQENESEDESDDEVVEDEGNDESSEDDAEAGQTESEEPISGTSIPLYIYPTVKGEPVGHQDMHGKEEDLWPSLCYTKNHGYQWGKNDGLLAFFAAEENGYQCSAVFDRSDLKPITFQKEQTKMPCPQLAVEDGNGVKYVPVLIQTKHGLIPGKTMYKKRIGEYQRWGSYAYDGKSYKGEVKYWLC